MALTKFNYNSFDLTTAASAGLGFNASANGFSTIDPSSMTLIKTLTASSSATLSFVHGSSDVVLDGTYPVYMFKFYNCHPSTDNVDFLVNFSADTGSNYNVTKTTTFFEAYRREDGGDQSFAIADSRDLAQGTGFQQLNGAGVQNENDGSISGYLKIFEPSSTTFAKHFISSSMSNAHNNHYAWNSFMAGYGNTTSAADAIQFKMSSGNIDAGTIKMYGVV